MDDFDGHNDQEGSITNLYLLLLAVLLSLLNNYSTTVLSYINVLTKNFTKSSYYDGLKIQLAELNKESKQIDMTDEFAKYARLQRRIIKVQDEIKKQAEAQMESNLKNKLYLQILLGVVFAVLMFFYKSEPVVRFPPEWFFPIASFFSWPGSDPGTISFTVWCAISNSAVKSFT